MEQATNLSESWTTYRIKINTLLDPKWADRLPGRTIHIQLDQTFTMIVLQIPDQAALRSALNQLWDLNLSLLEVVQIETTMGYGG